MEKSAVGAEGFRFGRIVCWGAASTQTVGCLVSARCGGPGGDAQMPVATAKEGRRDPASGLLVLLTSSRHFGVDADPALITGCLADEMSCKHFALSALCWRQQIACSSQLLSRSERGSLVAANSRVAQSSSG